MEKHLLGRRLRACTVENMSIVDLKLHFLTPLELNERCDSVALTHGGASRKVHQPPPKNLNNILINSYLRLHVLS